MNLFSKTTDEARKRMVEQEQEQARLDNAQRYIQRLREFGVTSITELNESQLQEFVQSMRKSED